MSSFTDPSKVNVDGAAEIRVPRETVNDDLVTIQRWFFAQGQPVRAREIVAVIETSKAAIDVESPRDGYIQILKPQGAQVPVGELIGHVTSASNASPPATAIPPPATTARPAAIGAAAASGTGVTISKKAQALLARHGIDPAVFAGRGMVRESDVLAHLKERQDTASNDSPPTPPPGPAASSAGDPPASTAAPPVSVQPWKSRGLFGDAKTAAGERGRSTWWLAWNYFWRNWLLGNLVRIAPRGVINVLHRMRGVKMGRDCFIDPTAVLETAYPENITIGDDVRITVRCVIMTHIKAPIRLRESGLMPAVLKPVRLESHSFIGVNSVIMPGVTVGEGAVVASGSVVVADVPAYTMVAGNPAKVIRRFAVQREGDSA